MDYRERVKKWRRSFGPDGMKLGDFWQRPPPKPRHNDTWGPWTYDAKRLLLICRAKNMNYEYEVALQECTTPGEVLDWIAQINGKSWGVECVDYLVQALDDILHLQANIVHLRPGKTFNVKGYLSK